MSTPEIIFFANDLVIPLAARLFFRSILTITNWGQIYLSLNKVSIQHQLTAIALLYQYQFLLTNLRHRSRELLFVHNCLGRSMEFGRDRSQHLFVGSFLLFDQKVHVKLDLCLRVVTHEVGYTIS